MQHSHSGALPDFTGLSHRPIQQSFFPPFLSDNKRSVFSNQNDTCGSCTYVSCQGVPVWMSRSDEGKHNELLVGLYQQHLLSLRHLPAASYIKQRQLNDWHKLQVQPRPGPASNVSETSRIRTAMLYCQIFLTLEKGLSLNRWDRDMKSKRFCSSSTTFTVCLVFFYPSTRGKWLQLGWLAWRVGSPPQRWASSPSLSSSSSVLPLLPFAMAVKGEFQLPCLFPDKQMLPFTPFHRSVGDSIKTNLQDLNRHLWFYQHKRDLLDLMDRVWSRAFPVWWFHPSAGINSHLRFKADGPALDPIPGCHNEAFVCMGVLNACRNCSYTSGPVRVLHTLHGCDTQVEWNYGLISCFFTFQNCERM